MVHFHSFPLTNGVSRDKAIDLAERLTQYQYHSRLILVPFASAQQHIITSVPAALRVVIYRRFMVRIAERIAVTENALALVTGESIGQVASQTLENITSIASAITSPILRPLIGMNKQDITDQARYIGTYDISKLPDEDCCSLFVPKHPAVKTSTALLEKIETRLDSEMIINEAIKDIEQYNNFDRVIVNHDIDTTCEEIMSFVNNSHTSEPAVNKKALAVINSFI